jgi:hypothetical protein
VSHFDQGRSEKKSFTVLLEAITALHVIVTTESKINLAVESALFAPVFTHWDGQYITAPADSSLQHSQDLKNEHHEC